MDRNHRSYTNFLWNKRGGVAIVTAIALPVLLMALGMAIDYGRAASARSVSQAAADAAAFAAAKAKLQNLDNLEDIAERVYSNNFDRKHDSKTRRTTLRVTDRQVTVVAVNFTPAYFGAFLGKRQLRSVVRSVVSLGETTAANSMPSEVVVMVDTTNSMNFPQADWDRWQAQLQNMVTTLNASSDFYMSVMRFQDQISVGPDKTAWLTETKKNWNGCVRPRGPATARTFSNGLTDIPPFQMPFVPTTRWDKDIAPTGEKMLCDPDGLFGPTKDGAELTNLFNNVDHGGTGRFDVAMAWGWRLVSPKWKGLWGVPGYPGEYESTNKIIILVTDGRTTAYSKLFPNEDIGDLGDNAGSEAHFDNMVEVCRRMKEKKIDIHIIYAGDRNDQATEYFEHCVSEPSNLTHAVSIDGIINSIVMAVAGSKSASTQSVLRLIR